MPADSDINFDRVAPFYDGVLRLCFGQRLHEFEEAAIKSADPLNGKALIIGGGTGRTLRQLSAIGRFEHIHNLELSQKMNARAIRLGGYNAQSTTFSTDGTSLSACAPFDFICLPFVLDCYSVSGIVKLLQFIEPYASPKAHLLVIDFQTDAKAKNRHSMLRNRFIQSLYWFFKSASSIKANTLPDIHAAMHHMGLQLLWKKESQNEWFEASYWKFDSTIKRVE